MHNQFKNIARRTQKLKDLYYYSYNEALRNEYEQTGNVEALEKYIISETLPPIEDFQNAVNIIR